MASINKVMLLGRLGKDPELRFTQSQTAVCTLSLATTEFKSSSTGEKQEFTEWHRVVVWGRQAENASKYLKKGRGVFVEGKIQTKTWDDAHGQKRYSTEIIAHNIQFLPHTQPSVPTNTMTGATSGYYQAPVPAMDNANTPPAKNQYSDNGGGFPLPPNLTSGNQSYSQSSANSTVESNDPSKSQTNKLPVISHDEENNDPLPNVSSDNTTKSDSTMDNLPF